MFDLPRIGMMEKKTEDHLQAAFDRNHGLVLGALLGAVSAILSCENVPALRGFTRMADLETWVSKVEPHLGWESGSIAAYRASKINANDSVLDDSCVAAAIEKFVRSTKLPWQGSASALLSALRNFRPDTGRYGLSGPHRLRDFRRSYVELERISGKGASTSSRDERAGRGTLELIANPSSASRLTISTAVEIR